MIPFPWFGGIGIVLYPRSIRDDHHTADGGRPARIDMLMDSDRQAGPRPNREVMERRSRYRKLFCVNPETRQGGSGLYDPDKE